MKTSSWCVRAVAAVLCALAVAGTALFAGEPPAPQKAKAEENPKDKQARVYRELFEKVGRSGLSDLTKDKDTGLALQASWELHKKLVKRTAKLKSYHPDDTYDAAEMKKFLDFLKGRTKAPVPDWWVAAITDLSVQKGEGHFYLGVDPERKELDKVELGDHVWRVRKEVKLTLRDDTYSYKSGDVSLEFPRAKSPLDLLAGNCLADVSAEKVTCLAAYSSTFARAFDIVGFENKGGKRIWEADVWVLARKGHQGPSAGHRVELTTKGGTVFVFGEEIGGLYLEAFDLKTGKCQFRFCTNYWGDYSEKWNLKPGD